MKLSEKKCVPCEGGVPKLTQDEINNYLSSLTGWQQDGDKIKKAFKFKDFKKTLSFVNKVGEVAEAEGHHPCIYLTYGRAEVTTYTHAIKGLSENDFILAAKIDSIKD